MNICARCNKRFLFKSPDPTLCRSCYNDSQIYYEDSFQFNTHWVSLDYPGNNGKTASIIKKLHYGDPIILKWSDTPFRDGDRVKVFTQARQQIGWVPSGAKEELETAVKNRWPVEAHIKLTGKVQDPDKNIWWAIVEGTIKIPCTPGTTMVYMTSYRSRYHLREDCGNAVKWKIPLDVALKKGGVPCPHCGQVIDEESK